MPLELKSAVTKPARSSGIKHLGLMRVEQRIKDRDRLFFTEQLVLLLETGGSIHASLVALKTQIENPAMVRVIDTLQEDIGKGKPFSDALSRHPQVFSSTYVNLIAASEDGGFMDKVLKELLEMEEKRQKLRNTLISALAYPAFLTLFSVAVVIFVLVVVFPKFSDLFSAIQDELPGTTVMLMAASELLRQQWLALLCILAGGLLGLRYWRSTPSGRAALDRLQLNTPLLREIFVKFYLIYVMRVMSLSLANGVSVLAAVKACKDVVRNSLFQDFLTDVEHKVEEGSGIAVGFKQASFIPPVVQHMITTGEETGNLSKVMGRLAEHFETDLSRKLTTLSKLAEPIMLLVMGLVVGVIVSALILPIFKLSRAVG